MKKGIGELLVWLAAKHTTGEISALDKQTFFAGVLALYSEAFSYGVEKRPINDCVLKHSIFAVILRRETVSIDEVLFFVERFHLNLNLEINKSTFWAISSLSTTQWSWHPRFSLAECLYYGWW